VTVGIVLGLASIGLVNIKGAIPIVLGANIGTCITIIIASIGTNLASKRTAAAHLLYNIIGAVIFLLVLKPFTSIIVNTSSDLVRQIANAHTIMKIIETLIYLPFIGLFAKAVEWIIPGQEVVIEKGPQYLEKHLINTPVFALDAASKEIVRMAQSAKIMVEEAAAGFLNSDEKAMKNLPEREQALDGLQEAITDYLMLLTQRDLSEEEARRIPALLHSVNDIERIGDHSENIMELAFEALTDNSVEKSEAVLALEYKVNELTELFRKNHIDRLTQNKCNVLSGIVFLDIISNLEKIGDHVTNIAQAVMGRLQWD
jgi:phosphate:Na+ symporter